MIPALKQGKYKIDQNIPVVSQRKKLLEEKEKMRSLENHHENTTAIIAPGKIHLDAKISRQTFRKPQDICIVSKYHLTNFQYTTKGKIALFQWRIM